MDNYFTEKIIDAILGECLCFYWGCKNLHTFIDSRAYISLNDRSLEEAYNIVAKSIREKEWEKRLSFIKNEKKKILLHYSLCPRIESILLFSNLNIIVIDKGNIDSFKKELEREGVNKYVIRNERVTESEDKKDTLYLSSKYTLSKNFIDLLSLSYREAKINKFNVLYLNDENCGGEGKDFIRFSEKLDKFENLIKCYEDNGIYKTSHKLVSEVKEITGFK